MELCWLLSTHAVLFTTHLCIFNACDKLKTRWIIKWNKSYISVIEFCIPHCVLLEINLFTAHRSQ